MENEISKGKGLIYVVEDDPFLLKLVVDKLKKQQFSVEAAQTGEEALAFLKIKRPTLLLLDLLVPGINGFQILEELRKNPATKDLPVVVLSNLGDEENKKRVERLGIDEYLIKAHFTLDEIVEKINNVIKKRYL